MQKPPNSKDNLLEVKFYLHNIKLTPYSSSTTNSNDILFDLMTFLNKEHAEGKAYFIDKNKNQPEVERREMFMRNPVRIAKAKRFKCSIALVRDKHLMLKPNDTFELVPFSKTTGSIVDVTHFFIDFSVTPAVMCVEFNNTGPRLSDIEYYLRNLAFGLKKAKACQTTTHLNVPIDSTLAHLYNVLKFEIKLKPQNITQMDDDVKGYITEFANLGNRLKPKFVRIEAMFQTPGSKIKSQYLNKEANTMIRAFLNKFKTKPFHIDQFEEFEIKFVNQDGEDEIFNLIKGKREIVIKIERDKHYTQTQYYEFVEAEFDSFIQNLN
ncbi:MAG TPA: hypothetical protein VGE44_00285 [Daejeonella sp.]|uniref:hypothetical protein n=1 Tax=Daejeonella sp. TaxID=2805397 RepID=UPI002EDA500D